MNSIGAPQIDGLTLVRPLGSGGYSAVYLYEMERPRMEVAVKVMNAEGLTVDARDQFTAEANAMAQLSHHPYIAQVHRADVTADGRPYIVMKYYPGQTYAMRVKSAPFSVADVLRAGIHVACAIETAHRAGILHRDIKPANVLTDQYGNPALTDFGIAAASEQTREDTEGMSLPWAPREVVFGTSRADTRSDIYSLGATLWHLLVGRSPFEEPGGDNSTLALMRRIQAGSPPPTGRGDVPVSLERLLSACMAKPPDDRPASALEVARALQAIEQEQHLPVTALTLAGEGAADRPLPSGGVDATRIRSPQTVVAQPPPRDTRRHPKVPVIESVPSPSPAPAMRQQRERVVLAPPASEGTVRVPRLAAPDSAEEAMPEVTSGRPGDRRRLIVGAVVVIALAGGGAAILSRGGAATSAGSQTDSGGQQSQPQDVGPGPSAPPGTPNVRVSNAKSGQAVTFRWGGYANALSSDTYRWKRSGSGKPHLGVSTKTTLALKIGKGKIACLSVQVIRHDGSSPSAFSDVTCSR